MVVSRAYSCVSETWECPQLLNRVCDLTDWLILGKHQVARNQAQTSVFHLLWGSDLQSHLPSTLLDNRIKADNIVNCERSEIRIVRFVLKLVQADHPLATVALNNVWKIVRDNHRFISFLWSVRSLYSDGAVLFGYFDGGLWPLSRCFGVAHRVRLFNS